MFPIFKELSIRQERLTTNYNTRQNEMNSWGKQKVDILRKGQLIPTRASDNVFTEEVALRYEQNSVRLVAGLINLSNPMDKGMWYKKYSHFYPTPGQMELVEKYTLNVVQIIKGINSMQVGFTFFLQAMLSLQVFEKVNDTI